MANKINIGWKLEVKWKDGTLSWILLKDIKASNPVELYEYALANNIEEGTEFKWWEKDVLRKRDQMISKVKAKIMDNNTSVWYSYS